MTPPAIPQRQFLIGVVGGRCSGKTTISESLAVSAGDENVALIKLDTYFVASTHANYVQRRGPDGGMNEPALDVLLARVRELARVN